MPEQIAFLCPRQGRNVTLCEGYDRIIVRGRDRDRDRESVSVAVSRVDRAMIADGGRGIVALIWGLKRVCVQGEERGRAQR